jgi:succinyl-CoA synthetase alpha subunit
VVTQLTEQTLSIVLELFENDPDTEAVIMIGEIGGSAETDAARWIEEEYD